MVALAGAIGATSGSFFATTSDVAVTVTTSSPSGPPSAQSAVVASCTNGTLGVTPATITFTGPVPSSWVAASGSSGNSSAGSAVVDTTPTLGGLSTNVSGIGGTFAVPLSAMGTLYLNNSPSSLGFASSGSGTIVTSAGTVSLAWTSSTAATSSNLGSLNGVTYTTGSPSTTTVAVNAVVTGGSSNGAAQFPLSFLSTFYLTPVSSFAATGIGVVHTNNGPITYYWTGESGTTQTQLAGVTFDTPATLGTTEVSTGEAVTVPVIADQSGGNSGPLGPTIDVINTGTNTISLEQMVFSGSSIGSYKPATTAMNCSASEPTGNLGDVIRAATCTAYGNVDGCPTYFMYSSSSVGNPTWDNTTTSFIGQDSSISGPNFGLPSLSPHGGVGGGTDVTMAANSTGDATWTAAIAGGQFNGINAFSNVGTYSYSGEVNSYSTLTQTYAQEMPCCVLSKEATIYGSSINNFYGWNMTEDYFTQPSGSKGQDQEELSIQNSYSNPGTVGTLTQNQYPNSFTAASGTSGTNTITNGSGFGSVTTGSIVQDATHSSYIPGGTTVSAVNFSTNTITLSANLSNTVTGDTINIASGWNYGVPVDDIQVGDAYPTPSTTTGTSGSNYVNVSTADFTNPATDMGLVTQGESITDSLGYIPANTYIGSVNQSSSTNSLTLVNSSGSAANLTGNIGSSDTITIPLLWFVQDGAQNHNSDGTCSLGYPDCGQLVMHAGCDWSDIADVPDPTGTIPIKGIENWLETHSAPQSTGFVSTSGMTGTSSWGNAPDPCVNPESGTNGQASGPWYSGTTSIPQDPSLSSWSSGADGTYWADYGYIVANSSVSELGQGWEILGTNSTNQTYSLSNFTIHAS